MDEKKELLFVTYDEVVVCNTTDRYIVNNFKGKRKLIDSSGTQISDDGVNDIVESSTAGYFIINTDDGQNIIDKDGERKFSENYFRIEEVNAPGRYIAYREPTNEITQLANVGLIDIDGNELIPFANQIIMRISKNLLLETKDITHLPGNANPYLYPKALTKIYGHTGKFIREIWGSELIDLGKQGVLLVDIHRTLAYHIDINDNITEITNEEEIKAWRAKRFYRGYIKQRVKYGGLDGKEGY